MFLLYPVPSSLLPSLCSRDGFLSECTSCSDERTSCSGAVARHTFTFNFECACGFSSHHWLWLVLSQQLAGLVRDNAGAHGPLSPIFGKVGGGPFLLHLCHACVATGHFVPKSQRHRSGQERSWECSQPGGEHYRVNGTTEEATLNNFPSTASSTLHFLLTSWLFLKCF